MHISKWVNFPVIISLFESFSLEWVTASFLGSPGLFWVFVSFDIFFPSFYFIVSSRIFPSEVLLLSFVVSLFLLLATFPIQFWYLCSCSFREIRGSNKFPDFFVWALLLIVHTWNSSPLRSNLLRLQCTCCTVPTTSGRSHRSPLVWACQWPSSQPLSSPQLSHNDSLWA